LWTIEELLSARHILGPDMTKEQVMQNFRQFGGVVQDVFCSNTEKALAVQNNALAAVALEQAERIATGNIDERGSFAAGVPKSVLIGSQLSRDDNGKFRTTETVVVSALVAEKLSAKYITDLWHIMLQGKQTSWNGEAIDWHMLEAYTRSLMAEGKEKKFRVRRCLERNDRSLSGTEYRNLGGCREIRGVFDPVGEAMAETEAMVLFYPVKRDQKLCDFVYKDSNGHFHVFQADPENAFVVDPIQEIQKRVGGAAKLSLYLLLPADHFPFTR
jgi:hypothetical protein